MLEFVLYLTIIFSSSVIANETPCDNWLKSGLDKCMAHLTKVTKTMKFNDPHCPGLEERSFIKLATKKFEPAPLSKGFERKGGDCSKFINPADKSYGAWGNEIVNYIEREGDKSVFMSKNLKGFEQIPNICPRWTKMTKDQKKHFWVWIMASIAYEESTCIPTVRNANGTNEPAVGLLQLEESYKGRAWRGGDCKVKNVQEPIANIKCGMKIMSDLLKGPEGIYKTPGYLYESGKTLSYWQKLKRPNGGDIGKLIKSHPYCNSK